jgi:hypothetical protein
VVLDFKAGIMLLKTILITKVIVQIGLVFGTISEKSEHSYVSQNWHKTQVFISYNIKHSNEQIVDCIGTILSTRFILTTATCIELSVATSPNLQDAVVTKIYADGTHMGLVVQALHQTDSIHKYKIEKFTIHPDFKRTERQFPDLAILKLTNGLDLSDDAFMMTHKVVEFYPQDNPGAYKKNMNLNKNMITIFI